SEDFHRRLRHDLRTPLNAIKGYSELLIEDMEEASDDPLRTDLARLKGSADQLLDQIDAMAALARQQGAEQLDGAGRFHVVADRRRPLDPLEVAATADSPSRILVVDDNAADRDVLERRLTREGHHVVTMAGGAAALAAAAEQDFDLVLL